MEKKQLTHILLGAVTISVLMALFAFGYRNTGPNTPSGTYELTAEFDSIDGLAVGSEVVLAGLPVGRVSAVDLNRQNNRPVVTIRINSEIELPFDSSVKVVSSGLAGGKYLKLVPGGEFEMMEPGEAFEYSQGSVLLEELLEKVVLMAEARRAAKSEDSAEETGD